LFGYDTKQSSTKAPSPPRAREQQPINTFIRPRSTTLGPQGDTSPLVRNPQAQPIGCPSISMSKWDRVRFPTNSKK